MRKQLIIIIALFSLAVPLLAQSVPNPLWTTLQQGNERFITAGKGGMLQTDVTNRMPGGQNPAVTILACADSRVSPELVFNQTIGSLFVVRTAGNVASPFDIASIEYAISAPRDWTRLIVVVGHSDCGAVKAALSGGPGGSPQLDALLDRIRESFVGLGPWSTIDVRAATEANARYSAQYLIAHSRIIRDAVTRTTNAVTIIPAYYDLASGEVRQVRP
jgi:carbonic anhydrase